MTINAEVTIGDLLTIAALLLTIITILIAWQKDRRLKVKEYASPIRHSAGLVIAKVRRWKILSSQYFDEIQPLLTDADGLVAAKKDVTAARDSLWRSLVAARAAYNQKIINEQIEMAFTGLYGYDLRLQALFSEAIEQLQAIDRAVNEFLLQMTQFNILDSTKPSQSAKLGNSLRHSSMLVFQLNESLMDQIVNPFCSEMTKLIHASDAEIANKRVNIIDPTEIFPKIDQEKTRILMAGFNRHDRHQRLMEICQRYPREVQPIDLIKFLNLGDEVKLG